MNEYMYFEQFVGDEPLPEGWNRDYYIRESEWPNTYNVYERGRLNEDGEPFCHAVGLSYAQAQNMIDEFKGKPVTRRPTCYDCGGSGVSYHDENYPCRSCGGEGVLFEDDAPEWDTEPLWWKMGEYDDYGA